MKACTRRSFFLCAWCLVVGHAQMSPAVASEQWAPIIASPHAQRNALSGLRTQLNLFQQATRTAPNYGQQAYGNVLGQFQELRNAYAALKQTLSADQLARGANTLAELDR